MSRLRLAALTVVAAAALAACTSSGAGSGSAAPPISVGSSDSPVDTSMPTDSTPSTDTPSGSAVPSTSPASTPKPSKPASSAVAGPPACSFAALTVGVIRGGAVAGQELAAVTFTNSSRATCSMYGFPGVSLLLKGAQLGKPADRTPKRPTTVALKPGDQVQSQITIFSSCNAPLSDSLRVYPPDQTRYADRPIELRGCRMVVDPVGPPQ